MKPTPNQLRLVAIALLLGAWFGWHQTRKIPPLQPSRTPNLSRSTPPPPAAPRSVSLENSDQESTALPTRRVEAYGSCYPLQVILRFHSGDDFHAFIHQDLPPGFTIAHQSPPLRALRLNYPTQDQLDAFLFEQNLDLENLRATPAFEPVNAPDTPLVGFGTSTPTWLGLPDQRSQFGKGVRIAILDTGILPHPQMHPPVESYDQLPGLHHIHSHGTSVASLITGIGPDVHGIAPAAELISIRVVDGEGVSDTYAIATGIVQAVQARADLINLSLGQDENSLLLGDAVKFALDSGCFIIAAAGNQATNLPRFPAAYQGVLSAGAVDSRRTRASFSNLGYGNGLSAPGAGIIAAGKPPSTLSFSGTSASAPIITASIAAIMSDGQSRLSAKDAIQVLYQTADEEGDPGPDPEYGAGIINPGRALRRHIPNLADGTITQVKWLPPADPSAPPTLRVTLQNRGTTVLANPSVHLTVNGLSRTLSPPPLAPGAIESLNFPLPANSPASPLTWEAKLSYLSPSPDLTPANNHLHGTLTPIPR